MQDWWHTYGQGNEQEFLGLGQHLVIRTRYEILLCAIFWSHCGGFFASRHRDVSFKYINTCHLTPTQNYTWRPHPLSSVWFVYFNTSFLIELSILHAFYTPLIKHHQCGHNRRILSKDFIAFLSIVVVVRVPMIISHL